MGLRRFALFPLVFLTFSTVVLAQKADVSFVIGGAFVSEDHVAPGVTCTIPCPLAFMKGQEPSAWQTSNWHHFI
jgi:hypothetical protein